MTLRRALPAGMIDAGFASVATFLVGFYAARSLPPTALGGYSIFFSAFILVTVIPAQLVLAPVEVHAIRLPIQQRLPMLRRSLRAVLPWAVGSACAVLGAALLVPAEVPAETVGALAATAVPAALLSPLQDHVRRMLHIGERSYGAAVTSLVQACSAGASVVALVLADVPPAAIPFAALASANLLSLVVGAALSRSRAAPPPPLPMRSLLASGRWLLFVGLAPTVAGLASAAIIGALASARVLGHAEAARVVAQPLLVVAAGLAAVLGPRLVAAGSAADAARALRYRRVFTTTLVVVAALYASAVSLGGAANPAARLLPNAFVVSGLVLVSIGANLLNGMAFAHRYELLGRGREPAIARGEAIGAAGQVAATVTAGALGAFAKPLGLALLGILRLIAFLHALRQQQPLKITQRDDE